MVSNEKTGLYDWMIELTKGVHLTMPPVMQVIIRMAIFPLILITTGLITQVVVYLSSSKGHVEHEMDFIVFAIFLIGCMSVLSNSWKYAIIFMSLPSDSENVLVKSLIEVRRNLFLTLVCLSGLHTIISLGLLFTPLWYMAPMVSLGLLFVFSIVLFAIFSIFKAQLSIMLANALMDRNI